MSEGTAPLRISKGPFRVRTVNDDQSLALPLAAWQLAPTVVLHPKLLTCIQSDPIRSFNPDVHRPKCIALPFRSAATCRHILTPTMKRTHNVGP